MYPEIYAKLHELEALLAEALNSTPKSEENAVNALDHAHDILVHSVAEWVRCAEVKIKLEEITHTS